MAKRTHHIDFSDLRYVLFATIIGILTGAVIASFRYLIQVALKWPLIIYNGLDHNLNLLWFVIPLFLLISIVTGLIMKGDPDVKGSGIPQVEAQLAGNIETNWVSILWRKFVTGVLTVGTGIFLGREGPSVQLGGAIGQGVAQGFKEVGSERRLMIATGAAAGLSATFSAPLAGTFFVMEGVYRNFSPAVWLSSLTGSICANFVSLKVFGLKPILPIFYSHTFQLQNYWQLIILGIILGVLGYVYNLGLLDLPKWFAKIKIIPWYFMCAIPILMVIPIGMFFPTTIGSGSRVIMTVATHNVPLTAIFVFLIVRFVFGLITYGAGIPGGFFMPVLAVGSLIGAAYGGFMSQSGLLGTGYVNNLLIFGMAGYFAAVSKAPFTSIMLITELVGNTKNFMALALVVLVSYVVVDMMGGQPIYQALAERLTAIKTYFNADSKTDRIQVPVYEFSSIENKLVKNVKWPENSILITISRGNLHIIPNGNTKIKAGDTLIVLAHRDAVGPVKKQLVKMAMEIDE